MATASTSLYQQLLNDPRWQKKRLEILSRDNFTCQWCSATTQTLHVHHSYYRWGVDPWDYPADTPTTLCADCHGQEHRIGGELSTSLAKLLACFRERRYFAVWHEATAAEIAEADVRRAELREQIEAWMARELVA
jgi:5-methylcytosine-specific restriction endonuclease McrA